MFTSGNDMFRHEICRAIRAINPYIDDMAHKID
jgi:hypothetical protein